MGGLHEAGAPLRVMAWQRGPKRWPETKPLKEEAQCSGVLTPPGPSASVSLPAEQKQPPPRGVCVAGGTQLCPARGGGRAASAARSRRGDDEAVKGGRLSLEGCCVFATVV